MNKKGNKPIVETLINTAALSLTSFGVVSLTTTNDGWAVFCKGTILIFLGAGLEFFKYWGRKKRYWN